MVHQRSYFPCNAKVGKSPLKTLNLKRQKDALSRHPILQEKTSVAELFKYATRNHT